MKTTQRHTLITPHDHHIDEPIQRIAITILDPEFRTKRLRQFEQEAVKHRPQF
jgi:hypothetical protein